MDVKEGEMSEDFIVRLRKAILAKNQNGFVHLVPNSLEPLLDEEYQEYIALCVPGRPHHFSLSKIEPVHVLEQISIINQIELD